MIRNRCVRVRQPGREREHLPGTPVGEGDAVLMWCGFGSNAGAGGNGDGEM